MTRDRIFEVLIYTVVAMWLAMALWALSLIF